MKRRQLPLPGESYESHFEHTALFEFSKVINSSVDLKFILNHILLTLMGKLLTSKGMVILSRGNDEFYVHVMKGFPTELAGMTFESRNVPQSLLEIDQLDAAKHPWAGTLKSAGVRTILPLILGEKPMGFLCFGDRLSGKKLEQTEATYLRSLANISATAIEKSRTIEEVQQVNRKLDRKIQELNTLFEMGKEFSVTLDPDRVIRLLVYSILGQIGVSKYMVCLAKGPDMLVVSSRLDGSAPQGEFLRALARLKGAVRVKDMTLKKGLESVEPLTRIGMKVVVPMTMQGECKGLVILGEKLSKEEYSQADLELLASIANLAIISLENARLFKEAIEKQKMEDELQIAREIQKGLLPSVLPSLPHFEIAATNISSKQVGGDYYDVVPIADGRHVIAIGDVSGKGTPASLLMANLQATIRALVPLDVSLSELTARVNDLMCQNTGADKFITFFWGIIDPVGKTFAYVNAGHNYPYLFHADGTMNQLDKGGMILGVMPGILYEQEMLKFRPGDLLILFTDGVSEALNKDTEEYGEERLQRLISANHHLSARALMEAIQDDIQEFTTGAPQSDDITMMVVKVH